MKIGICGHFMLSGNNCNGQAVKTMNYYQEICKKYGKDNITILDTNYFRRKPFKNCWSCIKMATTNDAIIIMPTKALLRFLSSVFNFLRKFHQCKIFYVVIGGWLPEEVDQDHNLLCQLKKLDGILVESKKMKSLLEMKGLDRIFYSPNFSLRKPISKNLAVETAHQQPYKFCTFSRVTKSKGILEAIEAVREIYLTGEQVELDIYGNLDPEFKEELEEAIASSKGIVKYKGILQGDQIIPTLSEYYGMLFPTYYPGEGFPGAVVEAMMAGVPVIASDWRYNKEVIQNGVTGIVYNANSNDSLMIGIRELIDNPDKTIKMRMASWEESRKYTPERVMKILFDLLQ